MLTDAWEPRLFTSCKYTQNFQLNSWHKKKGYLIVFFLHFYLMQIRPINKQTNQKFVMLNFHLNSWHKKKEFNCVSFLFPFPSRLLINQQIPNQLHQNHAWFLRPSDLCKADKINMITVDSYLRCSAVSPPPAR